MFTLTKELTKQYKESFQSKPERIVAQNAAVKNGLKGASETVASVVENQPVYSIDLEHGKVANQKASGRCSIRSATDFLITSSSKNLNSHKVILSFGINTKRPIISMKIF